MTNMFDVALERRERERLEREPKKPDMVDAIADKLVDDHISLMNECESLRQQLAECERDAERYRWLRENSNNVNYCLLCGYDGLACYEADDLDLQIDVAMKELATAGTAAQVGAGKTGEV